MKIQHYGAKDLFLEMIDWLCETPKSSFAFGAGMGLLSHSVPIILFLPFLVIVIVIGSALRRLVNEGKIPAGSIPAFFFGCVAGIFIGLIIVLAWFEYSDGNM